MLSKILAAFGFGWRRLGDASTFSWILPATWGAAVGAADSIATALVSAACKVPPDLWIPLAASVALLVLAAGQPVLRHSGASSRSGHDGANSRA
ncbi:hypothetical protein D3273_11370 [Lichenibacterium minor]|uniref:Uncharacterized protein n=1 Tax=Lichenibacterium minor TaxID=2316528 RepID=A0A4Q2U5Y9_9HYPH|nr:hypothetical protein [Lichenibacterium minor]RYC32009.1 hypothetical protein D3273_11370 [Lichenibacterium minor]